MKPRAGQLEFEAGVDRYRVLGLVARRQYGKTSIAARISLKKMMRTPGHTVVFGSLKLDLGREIVRKESEAILRAIRDFQQGRLKDAFRLTDAKTGKTLGEIGDDEFEDLYTATRLEFRLYHSSTTYSRTKVVALTSNAVGETGDLILDEVGRVPKFREVWEAVSPIIASNPDFRCLLTTTPPPDDGHFSFELLAPPVGTAMPVNPRGNWYRSDLGVRVLRIDAADAYADGVPLYDNESGEALSPEESRRRDPDKEAWDRNYGVKFLFGGTTACGVLALNTAQTRGIGQCACIVVDQDSDLDHAVAWLREHAGVGPMGIGLDVATTEGEHSNPSSITFMERAGHEYLARLTVVWKTRDPAIAKERIRRLIEARIAARPGNPPRRLCIDATSERYFAIELQRELAPLLPVELVIASNTVDQPGGETITMKALLGNQYVAELDDNHVTLAPERYVRDDHRLVKRDRGSFTTETGPNGEHGDTFDSHKLALHALTSTAGAIDSLEGFHVPRPLILRPRLALPRF